MTCVKQAINYLVTARWVGARLFFFKNIFSVQHLAPVIEAVSDASSEEEAMDEGAENHYPLSGVSLLEVR